MILLPAIDLLDGQCVRLRRGDFDTAHRVAADPLETARSFEQAGAAWIHMVDFGRGQDRQRPKSGDHPAYCPGNLTAGRGWRRHP